MKPEGPKIKAEGREWRWGSGEGAATPSPPARSLRSAVSSPSGVRGRAPTAQRFSTIFSTQVAFPDTKILLIVDHNKMKNSYPIQSGVNN